MSAPGRGRTEGRAQQGGRQSTHTWLLWVAQASPSLRALGSRTAHPDSRGWDPQRGDRTAQRRAREGREIPVTTCEKCTRDNVRNSKYWITSLYHSLNFKLASPTPRRRRDTHSHTATHTHSMWKLNRCAPVPCETKIRGKAWRRRAGVCEGWAFVRGWLDPTFEKLLRNKR